MEFTNSKIFTPYFNRSANLSKLKPTRLQTPVRIEEIRRILEKSLRNINLNEKKVLSSNEKLTRKTPSVPKQSEGCILLARSHFYPNFMNTHRQVPFIFKKMRVPSVSPVLKIRKHKFKSKKLVKKKSKTLEKSVYSRHQESPLVNSPLSMCSNSSSLSDYDGLYRTKYH